MHTYCSNNKNLRFSCLVDMMNSGAIYQNSIKSCSRKTVIYGTMGDAKTHVLTSNLEFIACVILKVDPQHLFCTQSFNFVFI
jgi:hypothetical protein